MNGGDDELVVNWSCGNMPEMSVKLASAVSDAAELDSEFLATADRSDATSSRSRPIDASP